MGRPKGGKNKEWSKEEKYKYVKMIIDGDKNTCDIQREYGIYNAMVNLWVRQYLELGIEGLQNKKKPGNPLSKYSSRKELTPIEQLEYENMLLRIENERLKNLYISRFNHIAYHSCFINHLRSLFFIFLSILYLVIT